MLFSSPRSGRSSTRTIHLSLLIALTLCGTAQAQTTASATVEGVSANLDVSTVLTETTASLNAAAAVSVSSPPASASSDAAASIVLEALGISLVDIDQVDVSADVQVPTPTSASVVITQPTILGDGPATVAAQEISATLDLTGACEEGLNWQAMVKITDGSITTHGLGGSSIDISGMANANATVFNSRGVTVTLNEQVVVQSGDSLEITIRPVVIRVTGGVSGLAEIDGRIDLGFIHARIDCAETVLSSDMTLAMSGAPAMVSPNDPVNIQFTLQNQGPSTATSAQVSFDLPDELSNIQLSPSAGVCAGTSCMVSDFAASAELQINLTGTVSGQASGTIQVGATASSSNPDPFPANNSVEALMGVDTDKDGVPDSSDNCIATPNPDQADEDGDGTGDACEIPIFDIDNDDVPDDLDNCPFAFNPSQDDSDGDGLGDVCDVVDGVGGETPCGVVTQGEQLSLHDGRFTVTALWSTDSESGIGSAVRMTKDSGYFWFFDENNVEVVVKVLDACGVNGRYWVSVAGLTDVEVEVTVVDSLTGATWSTDNEFGSLFLTQVDNQGLPGCVAN